MKNGNTQNLAEKIARLLQKDEKRGDDFLLSSLDKINKRLEIIEANISVQNPTSQTLNPKSCHASQEKFANLEELADEIIANLQNEKACQYEPTGKPCDHCAMCSSRGF